MWHTIGIEEQRRHPRNSFRQAVEFAAPCADNENGWHTGQALDLSFGGVRLRSKLRLREEDLLQVRLRHGAGSRLFVTRARVVHIQLEPGGDWLLGCEFVP